YQLSDGLHRADTVDQVFAAALGGIVHALGCDRASILLCDEQGVMRFVAWHGLSAGYRAAVDGHSPWTAADRHPPPIPMNDVEAAELPDPLREVIRREGIRSLAFIPLLEDGAPIGKFMAYFDAPHDWSGEELELAVTIARQVVFAVGRARAEQAL